LRQEQEDTAIAGPQRYLMPADLPVRIPVFPLRGALLLPRGYMPLNIFEPRYLAMVDDALAGERLVGIVQPRLLQDDVESPEGKSVALRQIGCVGRLTSFTETDDGRYLITLNGITRFTLVREVDHTKPYRVAEVTYADFAADLSHGFGEEAVDRKHLLEVLRAYLDSQNLKADWNSIERSGNEFLVNALSMMSPYGPEEKQALLEAKDLKTRAEILIALAKMQMAAPDDGSGTAIQ
jgi:Lon protease-like protein